MALFIRQVSRADRDVLLITLRIGDPLGVVIQVPALRRQVSENNLRDRQSLVFQSGEDGHAELPAVDVFLYQGRLQELRVNLPDLGSQLVRVVYQGMFIDANTVFARQPLNEERELHI